MSCIQCLTQIIIDIDIDIGIGIGIGIGIDIDIFVNCNCVDSLWQKYSTYLHKKINRTF